MGTVLHNYYTSTFPFSTLTVMIMHNNNNNNDYYICIMLTFSTTYVILLWNEIQFNLSCNEMPNDCMARP